MEVSALSTQSATITIYLELHGLMYGSYVKISELNLLGKVLSINDSAPGMMYLDVTDEVSRAPFHYAYSSYKIILRFEISFAGSNTPGSRWGMSFSECEFYAADLPPEPEFELLDDGASIHGYYSFAVLSSADVVEMAADYVLPDGSVHPIGHPYSENTRWLFGFNSRAIPDTNNLTIRVWAKDRLGQAMKEPLRATGITVDNTPSTVSFTSSLSNNTIIVKDRWIGVSTDETCTLVVFDAVPLNSSLPTIVLNRVTPGPYTTDVGFWLVADAITEGSYTFRATAFDRFMDPMQVSVDLRGNITIIHLNATIVSPQASSVVGDDFI